MGPSISGGQMSPDPRNEKKPDPNCPKCHGTGKDESLTVIWDAKNGCEHEWDTVHVAPKGGKNAPDNPPSEAGPTDDGRAFRFTDCVRCENGERMDSHPFIPPKAKPFASDVRQVANDPPNSERHWYCDTCRSGLSYSRYHFERGSHARGEETT